jgi:hypothetical protein
MKRHPLPLSILVLLFGTLVSCGDTEAILPRRDGIWDLTRVTTEKLNAAGAVDSIITQTDVAVFVFSPEGLGSVRNNLDNFVTPLTWSSPQDDQVHVSYLDATGDSLNYLFTVLESKGNTQKWEAQGISPKTGLGEIVNWELIRAK